MGQDPGLIESVDRLERLIERAAATEQQLRDHRDRLLACLRTICANHADDLLPTLEQLREAKALIHWVETDPEPRPSYSRPSQGVAQVVQFPPRATGAAFTEGERA